MAQPKSIKPNLCPVDNKPLPKKRKYCNRACYNQARNKGGRPTKKTPEVLAAIKQAALRMDAEDPAAIRLCASYSRVGETTLRDWLKDDDAFRADFEGWLSDLTMVALENRSKKVRAGDDKTTSEYLKERASRTKRLELSGVGGDPIQVENPKAEELSRKFTEWLLEETKK